MGIAHWDNAARHRRDTGEMGATWHSLGDPAGAIGVGLNRIVIEPGRLSTPPHSHGASEEIFYVLGGTGLSWQDEAVHEVRAGDCIVHVADHEEHTLRAGPEGLDVLVFGTRHPTEIGWLPRSRAVRIGWPWIEGRTDDPWDVEAVLGPVEFAEPSPRPSNILNIEDCPEERYKEVADKAGSKKSGLKWMSLEPGSFTSVPHCHALEEEVFVVLEGDGTLELWPSPAIDAPREDIPLRAGHVVVRSPGTGIAHRLQAGAAGMTLLVYGTRETNEICYYPRSNKIFFRGVGVMGRVEHLDYFDGEPLD